MFKGFNTWLTCFVLLAIVIMNGCSDGEKKDTDTIDNRYEGWKSYTYQNVRIVYPPNHPHEKKLHKMAVWYGFALRQDCRFLQIPIPQEELVVYYYTGFGQGREMTGHKYPFADSAAIHFWIPSHKGPTLMQYLLPIWLQKEPQYKFLKHGIITLFDYSGQDYHEMTHEFYNDTNFIPLTELVKDTTVDSNIERHQSAEAASFVDFLVYTFGTQALRLLYRAEAPFEMATQGILKVEADSLQTMWTDFIEKAVRGEIPGQQSDTTDSNP
ncbi:MAG: hypothetical protein U9R56_06140 [candidate division Zixibacteria bacterium]|nr:hypothetical protein [candidate division Zixibacteria bacterium]